MKMCLVKILFCNLLLLATTSSKPTKSTFLMTINLLPLKGSKVDLTLSNIGRQENCFLDRGNSRTQGYAFNTHKLVVPHNSSEFVSCRYELGPIDKRHIGAWTICGRADDDIVSDRCQRINILGTEDDCQVTTNHALHIVGTGKYTMDQNNDVFLECHVVTPYGEDLVLTEHSDYPGIRLLDASLCKVAIERQKIVKENWTVYGRTDTFRCKEVHYPMRLHGISASDDDNTEHFAKGDFAEFLVPIFPDIATKCYLVTPKQTEIDFTKDDSKYELRPSNTLSNCIARINDLNKDDEGLWSLHAVVGSEEQVQRINIVIDDASSSKELNENVSSEPNSSEDLSTAEDVLKNESDEKVSSESVATSEETTQESSSSESSSSEEDTTIWLSELQFLTRTELSVDINLPRIAHTEKCTFITPDNKDVRLEENIVVGVTTYGSSEYVSCRIVVGPMEERLIGKWTICGSYTEGNVEHRRCQTANIAWRNSANPSTRWHTIIRPEFDHVVHFGGILSPSARGSGNVVSCHLVTPNNEDLFVTRESEYPYIRLVQDTNSACSIAIGPIAQSHLGSWAIYGKFISSIDGYNEVRLPMNLDLYNKDHPYDQAYNVTNLNPIQHVVNLGSTIPVEVANTGAVDVCIFTMPSGLSYNTIDHDDHDMPTGVAFVNDNRIACRISIGPITQNLLGTWMLIGKFSNRDIFTERIQRFTIIQEDPSSHIQEEDRTIEYLAEQLIETDIGASERIVITQPFLNTIQSCHIRTPAGLQYTFMEGFNVPGIEIVTGSNVHCGVNVKVSEDIIGDWILIAREIRSSERIERRLPFKIYVEEFVDASPNEITITEGNALHVRLVNPTSLHETCKLVGPDNEPSPLATSDERYAETCGFVVTSVDAQHNGIWNIVYGTKIIYKAPLIVHVNARSQQDDLQLSWLEYSAVSKIIGPEETVYCRVISPKEVVVFDDFGRCRVDVDSVRFDLHAGIWVMMVGLPGRIVTERHTFYVDVKAEDKKPEVSTSVWQDKPIVELTCGLKSAEEKTGCLFRNPQGKVYVASQGVKEDRYAFHINQTRSASDEFYYSCGLQITDPVTSDLGIWRCDLESEEDTYFGFLSVLCPWAMRDPEVAASVIAEPVLTPEVSAVTVAEQESAVLACSARAPLRYCYFRAPNATVYNVRPGSSPASAEYAGAGLDAGECGMRVDGLASRDAGNWSCHAGFHGSPEQSHRIAVFVYEEFVVSSSRDSARLVVEGQVSGYQQLEYCRFVRIDGFGFTSDNPPYPYVDESVLSNGLCRVRVAHSPTDLHPWTVVAKIQGRGEISRVTGHNWPNPPVFTYNALYMWLPFLMILAFTLALAAAFAPAKNRRWAAERASSLRTSLRRFPSIRKKPLPLAQTNPAA